MSTNKRLDEQAPAVKVMLKWGTNAAFAKAIGKTASTTDRWLVRGDVPGLEVGGVVSAARRDGLAIEPADFVDLRHFATEPGAAK